MLRELEILVDGDQRPRVPAADLPQGGGRPLPAIPRRARSSSRSSSARATSGFGAGNFRALFESIERAAAAAGSASDARPRCSRRRRRRASTTSRCADAAGELRYEECLTRDGFDGPYTILYHVRPAAHAAARATADARLGAARSPPTARAAREAALPIAGAAAAGRARRSTRACRCCSTTTSSSRSSHPDAADPVYFANGDGDELSSSRGRRRAAHAARRRRASRRATTCSCPRACSHRFLPDDGPQHWLSIECAAGFGLPRQWRNEVGQLRMDAPYSHRDFRRPEFAGPLDEGIRDLVVQARRRVPRLHATSTRRSTSSAGTARSTRGRSRS